MINKLLLLFIFISCLLLAQRLNILVESDKYKKRNNFIQETKDSFFKNFISKLNFLKTKDLFLSKQGNPLNLNGIKYYIIKIFMAGIFFISALLNYGSIFYGVIFALTGYFLLDLYILVVKKSRDREICSDVLNVTDSINLQLSAHVLMKDALKKQYENCKNKDFKKAMMIFSAKYELSELNIDEAVKDLEEKFDILEVNMFCSALKEYNKMGNISEILESLSENLKDKKIEVMKANTREKILYITFGVIVALTNIILLTMYPLFISIGQGFNNIFK